MTLNEHRKSHGWRLREIAQRSRYSTSYIGAIERGYRPPVWAYERLARAYRLSVEEFRAHVGGGSEKNVAGVQHSS